MSGSFFQCNFEVSEKTAAQDAAYVDNLTTVFEILKPKPSPFELIRIGGRHDGAYLVPDDLAGLTDCFSPGVNNRKNFEDELANRFHIRSHMCDFSSDVQKLATPLIAGMQTFRKCWLDVPGSPNSVSLKEWVSGLAGEHDHDLLLQMDIEGAEYRNLLDCPNDTLKRFRIIVIELHGLSAFLDRTIFSNVLLPFFVKLGALFSSVHAHPNNWESDVFLPEIEANMPNVLEVAFIRKDRLVNPGGFPLNRPMMPHPLDITNNIDAAPISLNDRWIDGTRPLLSEMRMSFDEIIFENRRLKAEKNDITESSIKLMNRLCRSALRALGEPDVAGSPDDKGLIEVAGGRPFRCSSAFGSSKTTGATPPQGASGLPLPNFFFHTDLGVNEFITIDLEEKREIRRIEIGNRLDDCFERARLLFLIMHNSEDFNEGDIVMLEPTESFLNGEAPLVNDLSSPVRARYATIVTPIFTALHFSSFKIFASVAENQSV